MKKIFLSGMLAVVVAASWSFYPKEAEPSGYMMVVGKLEIGLGGDVTVTTVSGDGQRVETPVPVSKPKNRPMDLHQAELTKLNQLRQNGWRVVTTTF